MKIVIDADYLIFMCTEGKQTKMSMFKDESGDVAEDGYKEPLKQYKTKFKALVNDIVEEIAANTIGEFKIKGKPKLLFSDPNSNFRYDLQEDYKGDRKDSSRGPLFYRFREWALGKYGYEENLEADDVYGHCMSTGEYIGATFDKDCYKGTSGTHFNVHHMHRNMITTSIDEARRFNYLQCLMGDATDNIRALPKKKGDPMIPIPNHVGRQPFKVTEKLATELLDEFGWDEQGIIKAYESKGHTKKEAELTMRLILVTQWDGKKLKLFKFKKEEK